MNRRTFFGWLIKVAVALPALPSILEGAAKVAPVKLSGKLVAWKSHIDERAEAKRLLKMWMANAMDEEIMFAFNHPMESTRGTRITFTKLRSLGEGEGRG